MKLLYHFLRLIRWPNLVFIVLAQTLFHFCIYKTLFPSSLPNANDGFYAILCTYLFIAAGGYIINDYFDINIDQINKPDKVVVGSFISRRWVIFWHMFLSILAIYVTTMYFPVRAFWHIHLSNVLTILLLWVYSTNLKKGFLIGNVVISLLTAWSISVVYFSKFTFRELAHPLVHDAASVRLFKLMLLYTIFAFIATLIREAIKDMEDIDGDNKFGCRTMPIVWGLRPTKVYVAIWLVVVIVALLLIQLFAIPFGWWLEIAYCVVLIVAPLLWVLYKLTKANTSKEFKVLSGWVKFAMFFGILSMVFFAFLF